MPGLCGQHLMRISSHVLGRSITVILGHGVRQTTHGPKKVRGCHGNFNKIELQTLPQSTESEGEREIIPASLLHGDEGPVLRERAEHAAPTGTPSSAAAVAVPAAVFVVLVAGGGGGVGVAEEAAAKFNCFGLINSLNFGS